jgi:FkbH-like protein
MLALSRSPEDVLARCVWQATLFPELPKRFELASLEPDWPVTPISVRVHRNHAFEHLAVVAQKWLNWWGRSLDMYLGDYDDSLSFGGIDDRTPDLELLWLDLSRYPASQVEEWLVDRIEALRALSEKPILVLTVGGPQELDGRLSSIAGVGYCDVEKVARTSPFDFFSERTARLTGTRLSDSALLITARELACRWIPFAMKVGRKAIVVDLDNTLYRGVLGEQGSAGVELTPAHHALQQALLDFKERGFFLAIASRNEEQDVRSMFEQRRDFPLRWDDFSAHAINWDEKTRSLSEISDQLRVGVDSLVFVDDNPGELAAVGALLPEVGLVHGNEDPHLTARVLQYFPGLWRPRLLKEDQLRANDLAANSERVKIARGTVDPKSYLRSLQVVLDVHVGKRDQLSRMVELSQKTNQFNLSLARLDAIELSKKLDDPNTCLVTFGLRDRLSDSGLIGLMVLWRNEEKAQVEELTISCRALGRGLEDLMIGAALQGALGDGVGRVDLIFRHRAGPRNQPARSWLTRRSGTALPSEGWQKVVWWGKETCAVSEVVTINFHEQ